MGNLIFDVVSHGQREKAEKQLTAIQPKLVF